MTVTKGRGEQVVEAQGGLGEIGFRGLGKGFEPGLVFQAVRKPVGRDPVLGLDYAPNPAAIGAKLRRERGRRPHNRTR